MPPMTAPHRVVAPPKITINKSAIVTSAVAKRGAAVPATRTIAAPQMLASAAEITKERSLNFDGLSPKTATRVSLSRSAANTRPAEVSVIHQTLA